MQTRAPHEERVRLMGRDLPSAVVDVVGQVAPRSGEGVLILGIGQQHDGDANRQADDEATDAHHRALHGGSIGGRGRDHGD